MVEKRAVIIFVLFVFLMIAVWYLVATMTANKELDDFCKSEGYDNHTASVMVNDRQFVRCEGKGVSASLEKR